MTGREPRDLPIIFSEPMVKALLREAREPGTGKTQTRRRLYARRKAKDGIIPASASILVRPDRSGYYDPHVSGLPAIGEYFALTGWHKARPKDRLWVRENWAHDAPDLETCRRAFEDMSPSGLGFGPYYRATEVAPETLKWRPSIHMPRWASRLTLVVTGTRIERLQSISEDDARAEGAERMPAGRNADGMIEFSHRTGFVHLWNTINGDWLDNPWVVVLTFSVAVCNIDA